MYALSWFMLAVGAGVAARMLVRCREEDTNWAELLFTGAAGVALGIFVRHLLWGRLPLLPDTLTFGLSAGCALFVAMVHRDVNTHPKNAHETNGKGDDRRAA